MIKIKNNWIYIVTIILFIDLISKKLIINYFDLCKIYKIFSILNIFYIRNHGAAWNFLANENGWQIWFLSTVSMFAIFVLIKKIKSEENQKKIMSYSFIIGGALGNLTNRIFYGFVIDFIDIHFNEWHFATFNIADLSIFIGITTLIKHQINFFINTENLKKQ